MNRGTFTRPEMAIRRADELLSVGQPMAALSSISEVFSSKRFRSTPLSTLEPILIKFLELCVELKKGRTAKEGLHLYKNVAQNTSVASVETVIQKFLEMSRAKLAAAIAKVEELEGPDAAKQAGEEEDAEVEDLEATETPESILLSTVSEEKSRDRTHRALVTPWLRFLWEAYRTALDTLRNNARLEAHYQIVSIEAFQFCLTHQRKTEFRRLCEMLRSHLQSSQKYPNQPNSINLNDPDTLQRHLDTRFQQLNTAVELELWQEAFRTAEDIHGLLGMSKRAPKQSMMAAYYEKMVRVFGVGENYLFHAAAFGKLYSLHAARAAATGDKAEDQELAKLSSKVLLSALAVPVGSGILGSGQRRDVTDDGEAKGKLGRLTSLLGLSHAPTRANLVNDAISRHVLKRVSPELRELYTILEVDFHPLSITSKIEPILSALEANPDTARYVEPLKDVVLARLFQQLSQAYASLKIDRVVRLASFKGDSDAQVTRRRIERFVTEACRRGDLDVTIDHASGAINFDEDLFGSDATPIASTSSVPYDSVKTLQPSASTLLRTNLSRLATTLYSTLELVSPKNSPVASALASRALAFAALETKVPDERANVIARTQIIKRRRELADEQTARKEKEEAYQRTIRAQQQAEADAKRAKDDQRERELAKVKAEVAATKKAETERLLKELVSRTGQKAPDKATQEEMSPEKIFQLGVQHIEKEKKELATKLASVGKRMDHVERAFRKEEIPLLKEDYERQQARDREAHNSSQKARVEASRKQHADDLAIKQRLVGILPDYHAFKERKEKDSRAEFAKREARLKEQLEEAKSQRRAEHKRERERAEEEARQREAEEAARRAAQEEEEREAEEARQREEEERAAIEERRKKAEEEAAEVKAAAQREREAQRAKDQELIAKQRQREEEALARRQGRQPLTPAATNAAPRVGSDAWRKEKEAAAASEGTNSTPSERKPLNLAPRTVPVPVAAATNDPQPPAKGPPAIGGGGGGGWREREAARAAAAAAGGAPASAPSSGAATPAGPPRIGSGKWSSARQSPATTDGTRTPDENKEGDGFQSVRARGAYRPPGQREGGDRSASSGGGAYRPPGAQGGEGGSRWRKD